MKMKFTPEAEAVLLTADTEAKKWDCVVIESEHLFAALLREEKIKKLVTAFRVSMRTLLVKNNILLARIKIALVPKFTFLKALEEAERISKLNDEECISIENLFLALLDQEGSDVAKLLSECRIEKYRVVEFFNKGCLVAGGDAS